MILNSQAHLLNRHGIVSLRSSSSSIDMPVFNIPFGIFISLALHTKIFWHIIVDILKETGSGKTAYSDSIDGLAFGSMSVWECANCWLSDLKMRLQ